MDYRTKNRVNMPAAIKEVKEFYEEMEQEFLAFFTALQHQTKLELDTLRNEFCYYN
jgi:archaellum component FlaC